MYRRCDSLPGPTRAVRLAFGCAEDVAFSSSYWFSLDLHFLLTCSRWQRPPESLERAQDKMLDSGLSMQENSKTSTLFTDDSTARARLPRPSLVYANRAHSA